MERSKRFHTEGLSWKIENDYGISVFCVPHGGSLTGFYGREGLADTVGMSPEGSGFSGIVFDLVGAALDAEHLGCGARGQLRVQRRLNRLLHRQAATA